MGRLLARATEAVSLAHIRHVSAVPPRGAATGVLRVYRQVEADFGMLAPPVALHAAAPDVLAACWSILRETTLARGTTSRPDRETVAAAVSAGNRCPYCVDIHGGTLAGLLRHPDATAVAADLPDLVADPRRRDLARWARGAAGPPDSWPELLPVALTFHYLNRMVNVFLQDSPLPPGIGRARRPAYRMASWLLARLATDVPPGASGDLLPPAPLPDDLSWTADRPHIAGAVSRAAAVFEAAGERSVPAAVRALVRDRLAAAPPGLDAGAWLRAALGGLPARHRPVGRFTLLTAVASYRVTDQVVEDLRAAGSDDAALIDAAAWASWTAARRVIAPLRAAA